MLNIREHNRKAWNIQARFGIQWSESVSDEEIEAAHRGEIKRHLSTTHPVPLSLLDPLKGRRVLALAAGGGRQAPLLAAAGALVTLVDISEEQLSRDAALSQRWHLSLDMHRCSAEDLDFL